MTPKDYYNDRDMVISAFVVTWCIELVFIIIVISYIIYGGR